jgi:hypothetical protein
MFDPSTIFQRTPAGRDEIYQKKGGLTQSERLVLIMIDGTTSCQGVRAKLPVLTDERFQRALLTLQKKDLVFEVLMPVEGEAAEEVERTVVDRFLQQDPTDPLTIISYNPEDEFEIVGDQHPAANIPPSIQASSVPAISEGMTAPEVVKTTNPVHVEAMDESLIQQAESLAQEVRARRQQAAAQNPPRPIPVMPQNVPPQKQNEPSTTPEPSHVASKGGYWAYWMVGIGLAFIGGFLLARLFK